MVYLEIRFPTRWFKLVRLLNPDADLIASLPSSRHIPTHLNLYHHLRLTCSSLLQILTLDPRAEKGAPIATPEQERWCKPMWW